MRGKKNIWKLLVLPALAVCLVLPPAAAFASVAIGTSADIAAGRKVYFGRYPQSLNNGDGSDINLSGEEGVDYVKANDNSSSGNGAEKCYLRDPIEWRVLQNEGGKLFLLSEKNLDGGIPYHTDYESVTWETSTIRSWLNGYDAGQNTGDSSDTDYSADGNNFIGSAFLAEESGAIAEATLTNPDNPEYGTSGGEATADKIFFLSIQEAASADLGFTNDDARVSVNTDYTATRNSDMYESSYWWLRSPGYDVKTAAAVLAGGDVRSIGYSVIHDERAARPAFFLNLSSVLFTSAAEGGKPATVGSGLVGATAPTGDIKLKFTVTDSSQTLNVDTSNMPQSGATLAFPYSNATPGENQFVSCVLEQEGAVKYYGKLVDSSSTASGTLFVPLAGVDNGTYTLKIFSEQANGDCLTDYASEPVVMDLVVNKTGGGGGGGGGGSSSGGSSSGGGSSPDNDNTGGGTDTPVVTVDTATDPEAPAVVVTLPEVSVGYDQATGTATVPAAEIDAAIDQAIATAAASGEEVSEIKIVVPDVAGATAVVVPISVTKLEAAAGSPQETLTLGMTSVGTVTMDTTAERGLIAEAGSAETVYVVIEQKAAKDGGGLDDIAEIPVLTEPQKDALADDESLRAVYDAYLVVNGRKLEGFETTGTLTICLHYRLEADEVPEGVRVVYVPENGPNERMNDTRYDAAKQLAVFTTNHLSIYAVTYAQGAAQGGGNEQADGQPEAEVSDSGCGDSGGCDAGMARFALLATAMIAASAARKKR